VTLRKSKTPPVRGRAPDPDHDLLVQEAIAPLLVAFRRGHEASVRNAILMVVARGIAEFGVRADDVSSVVQAVVQELSAPSKRRSRARKATP
jgi:hypothetical protein